MALLKRIAAILQASQWSFALLPEVGRIKMKVTSKGQAHTVELQVREETQVVLGMLSYKRKCDPEYRHAMADFMNKHNSALSIGGLVMDPETGVCRFRHTMDVQDLNVTPVFVNNFVRAVASLGCNFWNPVELLMNGGSVDDACRMAEGRSHGREEQG
jgi:hypothetical protein